jgi:hypothetical protein
VGWVDRRARVAAAQAAQAQGCRPGWGVGSPSLPLARPDPRCCAESSRAQLHHRPKPGTTPPAQPPHLHCPGRQLGAVAVLRHSVRLLLGGQLVPLGHLTPHRLQQRQQRHGCLRLPCAPDQLDADAAPVCCRLARRPAGAALSDDGRRSLWACHQWRLLAAVTPAASSPHAPLPPAFPPPRTNQRRLTADVEAPAPLLRLASSPAAGPPSAAAGRLSSMPAASRRCTTRSGYLREAGAATDGVRGEGVALDAPGCALGIRPVFCLGSVREAGLRGQEGEQGRARRVACAPRDPAAGGAVLVACMAPRPSPPLPAPPRPSPPLSAPPLPSPPIPPAPHLLMGEVKCVYMSTASA